MSVLKALETVGICFAGSHLSDHLFDRQTAPASAVFLKLQEEPSPPQLNHTVTAAVLLGYFLNLVRRQKDNKVKPATI